MKPTEVKYTRRYTTEVQYEHEEFTATAAVDDGESAAEALEELKQQVEAVHSGEPTSNKGKKNNGKKKNDEEETEEEETEEESEETEEESEEETEEESEEDTEEQEEEASSKKNKKTGRSTSKVQPYNRENDTHKGLFADTLKEVAPNWKKSDGSKAKAKNASKKLHGVDFLDADGDVIDGFKTQVKKMMK